MPNDPRTPRYTTPQLASALSITRGELRMLLADTDSANRIAPTSGSTTRDQRWSALDAARVAVLDALPYRPPAPGRRDLYDKLTDTDLIAAAGGAARWLVFDRDRATVASTPGAVFDLRDLDRGFTAAVVVGLHGVIPDFLDDLAAAEKGTLPDPNVQDVD